MIKIRTHSDTRLTKIRRLFYPIKKKIISLDILHQLKPLALTIWYCDDGTYNYQHHYCRIFSCNFNYQEHLLAQKYFKKRWRINCEVQIDTRDNCYLHFNSENTRRFLGLVKSVFERYHVPKCMWYKLGHLYEGNKLLIEQAKEKKIVESRL